MPSVEFQPNVVTAWNEVALAAIRTTASKPTIVARALHMTHTAMFDAWAAYDPTAVGVHSDLARSASENAEANKAEAVSFAAFTTLNDLFADSPELTALFRQTLMDQGYDPDADPATGGPASVGVAAARAVLAFRATDGSNAANNFADTTSYQPVNAPGDDEPGTPGDPSFDPNRWQPLRIPTGAVTNENGVPIVSEDPTSYADQVALTPHWGEVEGFALQGGAPFRPPPPPLLGDFRPYVDGTGKLTTNDQAYRDQIAEVVEISANLTDEHKAIAEFWADGPRTESPPGHWNQLAQGLAVRDGHGIDESMVMFFALNNALLDASIATWDTKYAYDYIRPQSAIRHLFFDQEIEAWAGPNQGTQTILGQEWQPYQNSTFVTPPFPPYVSGHSTFSAAAAEVLKLYTGTDAFFDGKTLGNLDLDGDGTLDLLGEVTIDELAFEDYDGPPIVLRWDTLSAAADEAGFSRLYGGIHIQDDNVLGLEVGRDLGALVFEESSAYVNGVGELRAPGVSALPALVEAQAVAAEDIRELPATGLSGEGSVVTATFLGGTAAFDNAIGHYLFDLETGVIGESFIDIPSTQRASNGDSFVIEIPEGQGLAPFLLSDVGQIDLDLHDHVHGDLTFVGPTGATASVDDPVSPLMVADGEILDVTVFHGLDGNPSDGQNPLNADGAVHASIGAHDGIAIVMFEDLFGQGDADFNDALVAYSNAATLEAATLAEMRLALDLDPPIAV